MKERPSTRSGNPPASGGAAAAEGAGGTVRLAGAFDDGEGVWQAAAMKNAHPIAAARTLAPGVESGSESRVFRIAAGTEPPALVGRRVDR